MDNKYKLVVFDVDGTLLNTAEGLYSSIKYTIGYFNLPAVSNEVMATFIGPPIHNSVKRVFGIEDTARLQEIADVFRAHYIGDDLLKAKPYEGIFDVFEALTARGLQTAVATYKRQDCAEKIVKHFGFGKYTSLIYGADNDNKLKKKDIIKLCLEKSGVGADNAVMVGDSDNDAIAARDNGMDFIAVTYGYGFHTDADCEKFPRVGIAKTPAEILKFI